MSIDSYRSPWKLSTSQPRHCRAEPRAKIPVQQQIRATNASTVRSRDGEESWFPMEKWMCLPPKMEDFTMVQSGNWKVDLHQYEKVDVFTTKNGDFSITSMLVLPKKWHEMTIWSWTVGFELFRTGYSEDFAWNTWFSPALTLKNGEFVGLNERTGS